MIVDKDIDSLVVDELTTIREILARLNETNHLLQLVVDGDGRLTASVTDGDIRRALIEGANLEDPVSKCMHPHPVSCTTADAAILKLSELSGHLRAVPIVDDQGRPTGIVSSAAGTAGLDTVLIMAGGLGKRLGSRTQDTPKPLLPLAGEPILAHIINDLLRHGINRFLISAYYLSDQIKRFADELSMGARIEVLVEEEPLGTAGALGLIGNDVTGPLLVVNGDIVTRADFSAMSLHHQLHKRDLTIGAARYEFEIPYGVLEHRDDGSVIKIREKPQHVSHVSGGIYILEPSIYRMISTPKPLDMPVLIERAIADEMKVGIFPIHEYWLDMGRPDDLQRAEDQTSHWLDGK
jgi:dTDP-glucose pyrophosphorylase